MDTHTNEAVVGSKKVVCDNISSGIACEDEQIIRHDQPELKVWIVSKSLVASISSHLADSFTVFSHSPTFI